MIGKSISHYRILEKLGGGGMGVVYKAEDINHALRDAAWRSNSCRKSFRKIAKRSNASIPHWRDRAAPALNHSNICTIYEIDEHEGQPFIAMEFMEGQTLKHRIGVGELWCSRQEEPTGGPSRPSPPSRYSSGPRHSDR